MKNNDKKNHWSFVTGVTDNGRRIDIFLSRELKEYSRGFLQRCIKSGFVSKNGEAVKKIGAHVKEGDVVEISLPLEIEKIESILEDREPCIAEIVFEDSDILVVNKPIGISVEEMIKVVGNGKYYLAHRLDKDTSGLLVIAKNDRILPSLQAQWKNREVKKTYLVLVVGRVEPKEGRIEAPIDRSTYDRKKMAVSANKKARDSVTEYKVKAYYKGYTLLEAYPLTGRTHQIRVHFTAIGHPVCGDAKYGKKEHICPRQFLHAVRITFKHPLTGKKIDLKSSLPEDLEKTLYRIGMIKRGLAG